MNSLTGLSGLLPILMIVIFAYLYVMGGRDEPRANVVKTFLLGVIGLFVGSPMRLLDAHSVLPFADALLASIVFTAIPGEIVKLVIVNYYCRRLRSFTSLPAGIIYGGAAALGFTLANHITFTAPGAVVCSHGSCAGRSSPTRHHGRRYRVCACSANVRS